MDASCPRAEKHPPAGEGVLALGDPHYGTGSDPEAPVAEYGGVRLVPLPGTRREVEAVGYVVLLADEAT